MEWWTHLVLFGAGAASGFINSMAGGGSIIVLPALMLAGLAPDVANGTNRIGILVQSVTAYADFRRLGVRDFKNAYLLLIPVCIGAIVGALTVRHVPNTALNYVIAGVMVLAASFLFIKPSQWVRPQMEVPSGFSRTPLVWLSMLLLGFYAGFIQVGANFIALIILVLWGGFDLLHANAFKLLIQTAFTLIALPVFIASGKIAWIPGIALSLGAIGGAWIGARMAVKRGVKLVRVLLFVVVLLFAVKQIAERFLQ